MTESINQSRRRLFSRRSSNAIRPPWAKTDIEFTDICTRCDLCINHCETGIIKRGDGGFPEIDFNLGECTFCQQCIKQCKEPLFDPQQRQPWQIKAIIQDACLAFTGIWCQSCKDACDHSAIQFTPTLGQAPIPKIQLDACTGCGACVQPCPANAIKLSTPSNI